MLTTGSTYIDFNSSFSFDLNCIFCDCWTFSCKVCSDEDFSHSKARTLFTVECFKLRVSIMFTSVIREDNSHTSSSVTQSCLVVVRILEMTKHTLVARDPPFVAVDPLNEEEVSSSFWVEGWFWNVNLGEGMCFVDCTFSNLYDFGVLSRDGEVRSLVDWCPPIRTGW